MNATPSVRRVIIGTAGHIDHGKTDLVERLTGARTDRLKEEQERGMTIDVGYAAFALPDGTEVGLLDVPGHERLVRTMVAGATAMDLALLVIAADDGPMPQTHEHVEILDVLGVERLIVALTKTDLVDDETVEIAEFEIHEMLDPTLMSKAKIVRVSNATGEGIDDLKAAISAALPPERVDATEGQAFRMPILRAFVAPGRGAVVTGIPLAGRLAVDEDIEILPPGWKGRVRGIQVHKRDATEAAAHQRTALALSDVTARQVKRGMVVATRGVLAPARRLAVRLRLLPGARPLEHRDRVRLHLGAAQCVARVHVLEGRRLEPGAEGIVELEAFEDVITAPADRFVLRAENASGTLGGGEVVELLDRPLPRKREGLMRTLVERSKTLHDPLALVMARLDAAGDQGTGARRVAAHTGLRPQLLGAWVDQLVERGTAVRLGHHGDLWMAKSAYDEALVRIAASVEKLHQKDPALGSLPISAVRTAAGRLSSGVLDVLLDHHFTSGRLVREGADRVRLDTHQVKTSDADRQDLEAVRGALAAGAGTPPTVEDLEADLQLPKPRVLRALKILVNHGEALRAAEYHFEMAWVETAKARLAAHVAAEGGFTPADARTLLGSTRKWIVPLLEALDKTGFSRRVGAKRVLRGP